MRLDILIPVLAQTSTNADEIMTRIAMLFCGIGIVWLGLMAMIIYRTVENRRRKAQDLDPLPPFWVQGYQMVQRWRDSAAAPPPSRAQAIHPPEAAPAGPSPFDDMPTPDLAMLTGDFPTLDTDEPTSAPEAHTLPADSPAAPGATDQHDHVETITLDDDELNSALYPDNAPDRPVPPNSEPARDPDLELPEEPPMPAATAADSPTDSPPDAIELLRVWRDLSDGSLILEINGQRFSSLDEVQNADLERRFMNVVKALVALAKSPPQESAARPAEPAPPPDTASSPASPTSDEMPSMAPGDMLRQMTNIAMRRAADDPAEPPPSAPQSIPEQIDAILQARLKSLPQFQGRGIEVQASLGGRVIIKADGKFYEGIGEVEDDEIRALLEDVVREWEASQ